MSLEPFRIGEFLVVKGRWMKVVHANTHRIVIAPPTRDERQALRVATAEQIEKLQARQPWWQRVVRRVWA